ncbi:MAG TPA: ClpX C4-type zinc finger protein, partial [Lachnospiraceae bacterium]|nr:ClpX C4-type zinc finger protein [Lachnospiraceae bacterium]
MGDNENKDGEYEQVCCMCHRTESTAGKMLRLPINLYVCASCMDNISKMMDEEFGKLTTNGQMNYEQLAA